MHKPFTTFLRLVLLALALGTGFTSQAQVTYSQVQVQATSFNADVIADGTAAVAPASVPTTGTNVDVDGGGYYLLSKDYYTNTTAHTSGIPNNGAIPNNQSGGPAYQLAAFTGNNSLRMPATNGASGTLTFATPTAAAEVYLMAICGGVGSSSTANLSFTLTYSDGTVTTGLTGTYPDWFTSASTQNVYGMSARANSTTPISVTTWANTAPFFHQVKLIVPVAKVNSPISSITVTRTNALGIVNIMAVSVGAYPVCSVAPTTQAQATTTSGGSTALTTACSSTSIYLSLTGVPNSSGYTYQWQSSPDNATWTPISGATSSTYTATNQSAATYYRCLVYCLYDAGNGATATPSGSVQVNQTNFNSCYCTPTHSSGCGTYAPLTNVMITGTTLNNTSSCSASPYYTNYPVSTATATLSPNTAYTMGITVGRYGKAGFWIDYNQNGIFESTEYTYVGGNSSSTAGTSASPTVSFTVPTTALAGNTRMRVRTQYYSSTLDGTYGCTGVTYGETEDYTVTIPAPVACTGTPPAITLASSNAGPLCSGTAFTLTASGPAAGTTGLSYQFQSSPAGAGTFANLGAAQATATYTVSSQTTDTDYRVVVTCTSSSLSATSNVTSIAQSPFYNCYCTIAVPSGGTNEYITSFGLPGTNGFTSTSNPTPVPATANGNSTGYTDYTTNSALTTTLYQGATYLGGIALSVRSNAANSAGGMWIDYNHNSTFDASEYIPIGGSSQTSSIVSFNSDLTIPTSALTGLTRVRVRWRNGSIATTDACVTGTGNWYGEAEDYLITIAAPTTCSAPPASVTAATSVSSACSNGSFTLSAVGIPTTLGGYTYQWQSSPAGAGTFANISGATTQTYVVSGQTVATDYQLIVGCQYGGSPVTSNVASVGQNPFDQCYCTPAYTNGCGSYGQITNVQLNTLNSSSGCAASPYYTVVPAGTATTTVNGGSSYTLKITNSNTSTFGVWIDYNQNGTFESTEFVYGATGSATGVSTPITIPATALSGATRMRVRTDSFTAFTSASNPCTTLNYGEAEDYTITIVAPTVCAGTPSTTASATAASVCAGSAFTLSATNSNNATGLTYQWQSSPAGAGTFANISGATALTYTVASQTAATDYLVVVTCTASSQSANSNVVAVGQNSFDACYGTPTGGVCTNEYIRGVALNTLSNMGTGTTGTGCTGSGYTDYTANSALTTTLNIGSTYTVSLNLRINSNPAGAGLWIDYDHSGSFDGSEYVPVYNNTAAASNLDVTGSVSLTIPTAALTGATRMRVRSANSSVPISSTTAVPPSPYYGEVEDYLVTIAAPLPVELISFTAAAQANAVRLAWATAAEKNSERFDVERSADGKTFEPIGTVAAQGNSTRRVDYEFFDTKALAKATTRYYRLRQVDRDGSADYSPVRSVQVGGLSHLELYPNPAHRDLSVTGATAGAAVEIFDALGRTVLMAPANADGQVRLVLPASLPSGVYIVRSGTEVRRLTVE